MMKNLTTCISLLMLCILPKAHAQFQQSKEIKISGKVLDKKNKQAIPFVHVIQKERRTNLAVTDKEGNFSFTTYFIAQEDFTLRFSFVGYKNFDYVLKLDKSKNINDLIIYLEEDIYQLKAITIDGKREETSLSILKKVIENLDKNYTDKSFSYNYLYREVAKDTGTYSRLTEAHISAFWKDGFKADGERIAKVNQWRSSLDFSKFKKGTPIIDITLKNNHHWIRQRSMIFKMENLGKFEIKALEYNQFGKEYLYKIGFSTDKEPYITCEGAIYVSDGDFAVRKIEIEYAPSFVHFAETYDSLREQSLSYHVYSTYKEVQTFDKKADTYFLTYQLVHSKNRHVDETTSEDEYENEVWIEHFIADIQFVTEEEYLANWVGTMSYHGLSELNYDKDFWQKNKAVVNFPIDSQIAQDLEKKIPLKSQFEQRK
jgi:CarboxypepD_reg-like domain